MRSRDRPDRIEAGRETISQTKHPPIGRLDRRFVFKQLQFTLLVYSLSSLWLCALLFVSCLDTFPAARALGELARELHLARAQPMAGGAVRLQIGRLHDGLTRRGRELTPTCVFAVFCVLCFCVLAPLG